MKISCQEVPQRPVVVEAEDDQRTADGWAPAPTPAGHVSLNEVGVILCSNSHAYQLLRLPSTAFLQKTFSQFVLSEDLQRFQMLLLQARQADQTQTQTCDLRLTRADGVAVWSNVAVTAMHDALGQCGLSLVLSDITPCKAAAQFEQFRGHALELMALGQPLVSVLEVIAHGVEQLKPATLCCITLVDGEGRQVIPCVPADTQSQDSARTDACWSQAVRSASGQVLATLSIFDRAPHPDSAADRLLIAQAIRLAGIAIENALAARQLRHSEAQHRAMVESSPDATLVHRVGKILYANPAAASLFGAKGPQDLVGTFTHALIHPDFLEIQTARMMSIIDGVSIKPMVESKFLMLDGTAIDVEVQGTSIVYGGEPAIHISVRDITERKCAEAKFQLSSSVFTHAREGIMITDGMGSIIDVNEAFSRITGYRRDEVLGENPRLLSSGRQGREFFAQMWRNLNEQGQWYGEILNRRKNGDEYVEMLTISAVRDGEGHTQQYVALFSDITAAKEHQQQLEHIAHFDVLTNLPNRALLADRLHQAMAQVQRRGHRLAVAYIDLDGFKAINDLHGHEAGDQLLVALSSRMNQALRDGDTLARLGGDEFVAVLIDLADVAACEPMLARLLAAAAQPVQIGDLTLRVSASLGITFYPQAQDMDADQLLRQADHAMYQAKLSGKSRYHVFDAAQDSSIRSRHESLERIRRGLAEREFVLHYQPKVNMRSGTVIGAEALVRWQHPEKGLLQPALFLPLIQDHPLAVELGEWVIGSALTQIELWQASGLNIPISVNIGTRQLQQPGFIARLREILAAHPQVDPACLELEVLETRSQEDLPQLSRVVEACRDIGVRIAMDDFGTCYASLTYLRELPVAQLKIDQSFVRDMLSDPDDLAILEGVLALASAFRRQVIVEGVETLEHGAMLLQLGCELAQGYGIARPMPGHKMPEWSAAWLTESSWINLPAARRDDLPLLFAGAEHRAWNVAIEAFVKGERDTHPPLDHRHCRFGLWLQGDGQVRHSLQASFAAAEQLHRQSHGLAAQLCELRLQGQKQQAMARLGELHGLCDALMLQLDALLLHSRP